MLCTTVVCGKGRKDRCTVVKVFISKVKGNGIGENVICYIA